MKNKQAVEASLVKALLTVIGVNATITEHSDKPDIHLSAGGHWIGVEVTELHPDEGSSGSAIRAAEERDLRNNPDAPQFYWGCTNYFEVIKRRLTEKIRLANDYHCPDGGVLWLLLACQIPIVGRAVATHVEGLWCTLDSLKEFEPVLAGSRFERVFLHFIRDGKAFCWERGPGWHVFETQRSVWRQLDIAAQAQAVWDVVREVPKHPSIHLVAG